MSGWTILTFDPIDGQQWGLRQALNDSPGESEFMDFDTELPDDYEQIQLALCRELIQYDVVPTVGIDLPEVYARRSGLGPSAKEILEETADMWDRAVVLTANDTGCTGRATLYQSEDDRIVEIDEYSEHQCMCCGGREGRVAAAYMMYEHHIDVLADFYDKPYRTLESEDEIDDTTL